MPPSEGLGRTLQGAFKAIGVFPWKWKGNSVELD